MLTHIRNEKGNNMKKKIFGILIILCLLLLIYGAYKFFMWESSNKENDSIQKELEEEIIENQNNNKEENYIVDFEKLKKKNADTVAYLKVNNTKIDYVVVRGKNNSYYLNHNFNKNKNVAGWVFADYHNKYNGKDKNLVIYGHNMKNGSMFGTLKNVLKKEWYKNKNNHKLLLVDERGTYYYQVFSTYSIKVEDYYINTKFKNDDEFYKFIKVLKNRSIYNFNVDLKKTDKILTLSTCSSGGNMRVVLHAKLINDSE